MNPGPLEGTRDRIRGRGRQVNGADAQRRRPSVRAPARLHARSPRCHSSDLAQRQPSSGDVIAEHSCHDQSGATGGLRPQWDRRDSGTAAVGETLPASPPRPLRSSGRWSPSLSAIVVATLYIAQDVLVPITLAVMLSFVLSPLVDVLQPIGLWRAAAVAVSVLVALGAIGLIGTLLGSQAATLAADVPHYVEVVQSKVERIQALATSRIASISGVLGGGKPESARVPLPAVPPQERKPEAAPALPGAGHSNSRSSSSSHRPSPRCSRSRGPLSSRSLDRSRPRSLC